jgi:hypothetical protein
MVEESINLHLCLPLFFLFLFPSYSPFFTEKIFLLLLQLCMPIVDDDIHLLVDDAPPCLIDGDN